MNRQKTKRHHSGTVFEQNIGQYNDISCKIRTYINKRTVRPPENSLKFLNSLRA